LRHIPKAFGIPHTFNAPSIAVIFQTSTTASAFRRTFIKTAIHTASGFTRCYQSVAPTGLIVKSNPFQNSYRSVAPTELNVKSNPFQNSYRSVATTGLIVKSNPFQNSYQSVATTGLIVKSNPFQNSYRSVAPTGLVANPNKASALLYQHFLFKTHPTQC
jgi:hypothetical protein